MKIKYTTSHIRPALSSCHLSSRHWDAPVGILTEKLSNIVNHDGAFNASAHGVG